MTNVVAAGKTLRIANDGDTATSALDRPTATYRGVPSTRDPYAGQINRGVHSTLLTFSDGTRVEADAAIGPPGALNGARRGHRTLIGDLTPAALSPRRQA